MRILIFILSLLSTCTVWSVDLTNHPDKNIPATLYFSQIVNDTPVPLVIGEIQFMLYKLGLYPSFPNGKDTKLYRDAVKKFQQLMGFQQTGELSAGQWYILLAKYNNQPGNVPMKEVYPISYNFEKTANNVFVEGTWQFENDDMAMLAPIQTSDIRCDKTANACAEARALLINFPSQDLLDAHLVVWHVTKWDDNEIIAENNSAECVAYTLFINLRKETVSQSRRAKACFGESTTPTTLLLQDGDKIAKAYYKQQQTKYATSVNPPKLPQAYKP